MSVGEGLLLALRALRVNALRSALAMQGVVVGAAAVIAMVAIGDGASLRIAEQIRALGANLLLVQPGAARQGAVRLGAGSGRTLTDEDARALAADLSAVHVAAPSVSGNAHLVRGNRNWSTLIGGAGADYLIALTGGSSVGARSPSRSARAPPRSSCSARPWPTSCSRTRMRWARWCGSPTCRSRRWRARRQGPERRGARSGRRRADPAARGPAARARRALGRAPERGPLHPGQGRGGFGDE